MTDYFTEKDVSKNIRDPSNLTALAGASSAGKASLQEILESPEMEDMKKRLLKSETDITTLRQVAKNVEVLQQEIV